ncbi:hypothetical protein F2P81_018864 [Scophthalmus maximus]|uniref:Uncharacterized protein n=1 Tax=Scophthalmus maximus TaxID=52904 RepID=A0A6A4SAW1_SCOMX|nr:hypothetical protein F2P81_018864 [Scophthalmus maximus]
MTNMVTDRGEGLSALVTRQLTVDPRRRTDPLGRMAHSTVVCQANALVRRSVGRYIIHLRAVSCQGRTTVASAGEKTLKSIFKPCTTINSQGAVNCPHSVEGKIFPALYLAPSFEGNGYIAGCHYSPVQSEVKVGAGVGRRVFSASLSGRYSATSRRGVTSRIRYFHVSSVQCSSLEITCSRDTSIFHDDGPPQPPSIYSLPLLPLNRSLSSIPPLTLL